MIKSEVVWLIIRLIGLYFAYLTIISLFGLIGSAPALIFMPPALGSVPNSNTAIPNTRIQALPYNANPIAEPLSKNNAETTRNDKDQSENVKIFLWYILLTAVYGVVGWYLLRDGKLFYALLMREELIKTSKAESEVTTLNL
jgi:hypothetical protein